MSYGMGMKMVVGIVILRLVRSAIPACSRGRVSFVGYTSLWLMKLSMSSFRAHCVIKIILANTQKVHYGIDEKSG